MAHAVKIFEAFGGTRKLAAAIGFPPSTVQYWKESGLIPAKHQQLVLEKARELDLQIGPADFFDAPDAAEPAAPKAAA